MDAAEVDRMMAQEAMALQKVLTEAHPFQAFVEAGHMKWLKENVFAPMEHEMLLMIKGLDFVPNNIAQLAHIKGQLEVLDRVEARIEGRIQGARDARSKLDDIQNSTPQEG